jgi:hypothetical protein
MRLQSDGTQKPSVPEVGPFSLVFRQRSGTVPSQKPRTKGAACGFERQAAALEKPEKEHDENRKNERPKASMYQEKEDRRKRASVNAKKTSGLLRISPVIFH